MTESWDDLRTELIKSGIGTGRLTQSATDPSTVVRAEALLAHIIAERRRSRRRRLITATTTLAAAAAITVMLLSGGPTATTPDDPNLRALAFAPSAQTASQLIENLPDAATSEPESMHVYRWSASNAAGASVQVVTMQEVRTYAATPPDQRSGKITTQLPDQAEQVEPQPATTPASGVNAITRISDQARRDCPGQIAWCTASRLVEYRTDSDSVVFDSQTFWTTIAQTPGMQSLGTTTSRTGVPVVGIAAESTAGERITLLLDPQTGALVGAERTRHAGIVDVVAFW